MSIESLEKFVLSIYDVKDQFKRWVYDRSLRAFAAGNQARDDVRTVEQLQARQADMRGKLIAALGGLPESDSPLHAQVTGTVAGDGYRIDKVMFQSRPSAYVTANLYMPDGIDAPRAAVLFLCGHADAGKQYPRYQSVCQRLVAEGLIVLAVDPIGQGERLGYYNRDSGRLDVQPCTAEHDFVGNQCLPLGDGLARYFVHDAMRAIDYLCSLPEVDSSRIGVTGNSGGGTQTSLVMVCDPRIAAAAPGTFIMSRESYILAGQSQDAEQIWRSMSKHGFDHEDILMALAPRPVLVLAATADFFPIEGTRSTVARTKRFWELFGVANRIGLQEDRSVHQYSPRLADAAARFFAEHLLGDRRPLETTAIIAPLDRERLNSTRSGQVRGDIDAVRGVYEENVDRLQEIERKLSELSDEARRQQAMQWLNERVIDGRTRPELNPRFLPLPQTEGLSVESYMWWSQEGIFNHGFVFRDPAFDGQSIPVSIGLWEGGTKQLRDRFEWIRQACASGRIVFVLDVTGDGICTPQPVSASPILSRFGTMYKLTTDLFWLDDSLAAVRSYDVIRALDMAQQLPDAAAEAVHLHAFGRYSIYAEIAAALDRRIEAVETTDGTHSVADWVRTRLYEPYDTVSTLLPGMLQLFDLPDLRRWRNAGAK